MIPDGFVHALQHRGGMLVMQGVARSPKADFIELPGISDITAGRITAWFGNPDNFSLATQLDSLWAVQPVPARQPDVQLQQGLSLAGITLAPGDEIVATGAIAVSRPQIKRWCGTDAAG